MANSIATERQLERRREQRRGTRSAPARWVIDRACRNRRAAPVAEIVERTAPERLVEAELVAMSWACRSGVMPRSPASTSTGSPGTRRIRMKATKVMPMKVGIRTPRRARMKRIIAALPRPAHARFPPDRPSLPLSRPPERRDVPSGEDHAPAGGVSKPVTADRASRAAALEAIGHRSGMGSARLSSRRAIRAAISGPSGTFA